MMGEDDIEYWMEFETFVLDFRDDIEYIRIGIQNIPVLKYKLNPSNEARIAELDEKLKDRLLKMIRVFFVHGGDWGKAPKEPVNFWWRYIPYYEYIKYKENNEII